MKKAERFESMARKLESEWRDEKAMNASLMDRVHLAAREAEILKREKRDLEEQNRDLGFFISGGETLAALKLQEGEREGGLGEEEVREGTVALPPSTHVEKDKGGKVDGEGVIGNDSGGGEKSTKNKKKKGKGRK